MIIDGCQYRRVDKVKNIADWDIAQKYLNVCLELRALLEVFANFVAAGNFRQADKFSAVFDVEKYWQMSFEYKIRCLQDYGKKPFESDNVDFARENNFPMPTLD